MSAVLAPQPPNRLNVPAAEWALRVQLAGAYRVADHLGWSELIYTHISVRVPGPEHHFLINPYGLRFDEVTASSLVKIDVDGNPVGTQQLYSKQGRLHHPQRDPHGAPRRAVRLAHAHARRHGGLGAGRGPAAGAHVLAQLLEPALVPRLRGPEHAAGRAHAPGCESRADRTRPSSCAITAC